jgi:hypothetical protein
MTETTQTVTPNLSMIPEDELNTLREAMSIESVKLLNEKLVPKLREMSKYQGPVELIADPKFSFEEENGKWVFKQTVNVSLNLPTLPSHDIFGQVEQTLFRELFNVYIAKQ